MLRDRSPPEVNGAGHSEIEQGGNDHVGIQQCEQPITPHAEEMQIHRDEDDAGRGCLSAAEDVCRNVHP